MNAIDRCACYNRLGVGFEARQKMGEIIMYVVTLILTIYAVRFDGIEARRLSKWNDLGGMN